MYRSDFSATSSSHTQRNQYSEFSPKPSGKQGLVIVITEIVIFFLLKKTLAPISSIKLIAIILLSSSALGIIIGVFWKIKNNSSSSLP